MISRNLLLFVLLALYIFLMVSVIDWGLPGISHPFVYHMDEWHQLQAVRALFTQGSPNVPGAAHGTLFHFFLSGVFLIPFTVFGIVDPFTIQSAVENLDIQRRIFEVLRLNTLLFGLLSIILISVITKKIFKGRTLLAVFIFVFNPAWLSLSNYFKYDIALIFWILLSLYFVFHYLENPSRFRFAMQNIFCALSASVKITALPLFAISILSFFLFAKNKTYKTLILGVITYFLVLLLFGFTDLLYSKGDYYEFFYSNLFTTPSETENYILGMPFWIYLIFRQYPINFGHALSILFVFSLISGAFLLFKNRDKETVAKYRKELFFFCCFLLFLTSLIPVKLFMSGNRSLVLLPFIAIITGVAIEKFLFSAKNSAYRVLISIFFFTLIAIQIFESLAWMNIKWNKDVRESSSIWIKNNVAKGSLIGIENIPIYQMLPDVLLSEFYKKEYNQTYKSFYNISLIDLKEKKIPPIIVVTNSEIVKYQKKSDKKNLLERLMKENYKEMIRFHPDFSFYSLFGNKLDFFIPNLVPSPVSISIFERI